MNLPQLFQERMQKLLGEEYEAYLETYKLPKYQGIRINTIKVGMQDWQAINPFESLKEVPWCKEGFYYQEEHPAKHPYYFAGLYYIQEPSAMTPGAYLPIEEGDKVLDLCAAPGGKSTQILAKLNQSGVLIANDISAGRTKALLKNLENFGGRNFIVMNESAERIANKCSNYFDKILIDAPCSGEGMFRKDEQAIRNWESFNPEECGRMQSDILNQVDPMLKVGGMILYSTCTFAPEENEGMIEAFLKEHPNYEVVPLQQVGGIQPAKPEWANARTSLSGALRLWPHHLEGEGHFVCLLQKVSGGDDLKTAKPLKVTKRISDFEPLKTFIETYTYIDLATPVMEVKGKIYAVPEEAPDTSGLRVLRTGLLLGEIKNKRFEPHHTMVLAYPKEMFKAYLSLHLEDEGVRKYLKGETLLIEAKKGYHVLGVGDYPLGWVKSHNGMLKNQYPPAWRLMG